MKKLFIVCLAAFLLAGLYGLSKKEIRGQETESIKLSDTTNVKEIPEHGEEEEPVTNLEKCAVLADDIYEEQQDNIMFSPLSLNMALGLLSSGADGVSKKELDAFLGRPDYGTFAEQYFSALKEKEQDWEKMNSCYEEEIAGETLRIANSIWTDKTISLKEAYRKDIKHQFQAKIKSLDFANSTKTADTINDWCQEKTENMIPSIVNPEMITSDSKAILVNAVYFKAPWKDEWDYSENGEPETFVCADGSKKELHYMSTYEIRQAYENDKAEAFSCPYIDGTEFIGILPKDEAGDFTLFNLDIENLIKEENAITGYDEVHVKMPKLDFETNMELTDSLKKVGFATIFNDAANFSGISKESLKVSQIIQKTKLSLDEYGTKAAAATAISVESIASALNDSPKKVKEIYLNRPFAFLIYDRENDVVLFMGKVVKVEG